jgi:uncharacterized membrane protein
MKKNISISIILLTILFAPFIGTKLAYVEAKPIVPDCGTLSTPTDSSGNPKKDSAGNIITQKVITNPCDFDDLMDLINNLINFLLFVIATPLVAIILCYVGFKLLTSGGNSEGMTKAKTILKNVIFGYIIALIAWLLIKTILTTVGIDPKDAFLIEF